MAKYGTQAAIEDLERVNAFKDSIFESSKMYHVKPCLVAAIVSRETRGLPKFFIGDGGHGCGPMQVDDRTDPDMCFRYKAGTVKNSVMINIGCKILHEKFEALRKNVHIKTEYDLERAACAAYNCGQGNVAHALRDGRDVDYYTTGKNYSADVLERAAYFVKVGYVL